VRGEVNGITVYDDFAHHPTAIAATLAGLRKNARDGRLLAILEPRSNTMRLGVHRDRLAASLSDADAVWLYQPDDMSWDIREVTAGLTVPLVIADTVDELVASIIEQVQPGDRLVVMSNGGFGGIHEKLLEQLASLE
jgi:UDP-N-acetylmuramate: L-alanyl-gamma-D-glutamyl-meso-diaminopimelate ligase